MIWNDLRDEVMIGYERAKPDGGMTHEHDRRRRSVRRRGAAPPHGRERCCRSPRWRGGARLVIMLRLGLLVVILGGWEIAARLEWIDPFFFAMPSQVGDADLGLGDRGHRPRARSGCRCS